MVPVFNLGRVFASLMRNNYFTLTQNKVIVKSYCRKKKKYLVYKVVYKAGFFAGHRSIRDQRGLSSL